MPLTPATRLGLYEIIAPLGAGGMGEVYRARAPKLNRDVALKILPELFAVDPDRRARFTREAQVLAFTRVFLRSPGLVILDEASSRLDPATERLIERAVDRLLADRTGIIIAHRLATVQRADEIMILERGRIVEHGPRAALVANPASRFAALLRVGMAEVLA